MKILLTGATGYLGGHLCRRLIHEGHHVVAVHLNHAEQMVPLDDDEEKNVTRVYLENTPIEEIIERHAVDGVIHTATLYGRSNESVASMVSANVVFPVAIMTSCIKNKVGFFMNTDSMLAKDVSHYALTKGHVVDWMKMFADQVKMVDMKLDHFYGPNDKNTKFVAFVLEKLLRNEPSIDLTAGTQTRDFIYVDDVVDAYVTVINNLDKIKLGSVAVFEVGTNVKTSIRYLVTKLKELTKATTALNFGAIPFRRHEMLDYDVDTTALRLLGWSPKVSIDEGLAILSKEG